MKQRYSIGKEPSKKAPDVVKKAVHCALEKGEEGEGSEALDRAVLSAEIKTDPLR